MMEASALAFRSRDITLLGWCVAVSVLTHVLMLTVLPGWHVDQYTPPMPLTVELREPPAPPEIVAPKPLPMETRPVPKQRPKPMQAVVPERAPILTASPEALPSPVAPMVPVVPIVPEQRPASPPVQATEPPRAPPAPAVTQPAPVTPPRSDAAHLSNPAPTYPLAAKRRGDQGTVLVHLIVTANGLAKNVAVEKSSGFPALDEAAVAAVRNWRFVPARQGAQAIDLPYTQSVVFKLD